MKKLLLVLSIVASSSLFAQKHLASNYVNPDLDTTVHVASFATISLMSTKAQSEKVEGLIAEASSEFMYQATPTAANIHNTEIKLNNQQLMAYIKALNTDAVMVVNLMPYGKKKELLSFSVNDNAQDPRFKAYTEDVEGSHNFYNDIYPSYQLTGSSETWGSSKYVRVKFVLATSDGEITIWSAFSDFIKTSKLEDELPELIEEMMAALSKENLITPKK